jgi:peptidoglycan hydrolase-like protein with peptidoglycan-binding domain
MHDDSFPTGRFASRTLELQKALNASGYGPVQEDGWYGPNTEQALKRYHQALIQTPPPAVPWWKTRRAKGLAVAAIGVLSTAVPAVGAVLATVDVVAITDALWYAMDGAEQGAIIGGAAITLGGAATSIIGAWKAKGPIDTGLIANVKGHEVRFGSKPDTYWDGDNGPLGPQ